MCGLFGFIGLRPNVDVLREASLLAARRGPQSCGWVTARHGALGARRYTLPMWDMVEGLEAGGLVLGHCRLATSGDYDSIKDTQPLLLSDRQPDARMVFGEEEVLGVAMCHNGSVDVDRLNPKGMDSGCDTEALLRRASGGTADALGNALLDLGNEVPYAILMTDGEKVLAACRGLPLYVDKRPGGVYFCSLPLTSSSVRLGEGKVEEFSMGDHKDNGSAPRVRSRTKKDVPRTRSRRKTKVVKAKIRVARTIDDMPVSKPRWVLRESLKANNYNPNHMAPNELDLLKVSIMEDGWTQPIVVMNDGEIVDGYNRWMLSSDPDVAALTDGQVPIVVIPEVDPDHQRMSTIRHNRARGTHGVLKMAEIIRYLIDERGMSEADIMRGLGMEDEEVDRLYDTSGMPARGSADEFKKGWAPDV